MEQPFVYMRFVTKKINLKSHETLEVANQD